MTLTYNQETLTVPQWAKRLGISAQTIYNRIHLGWPPKDIIERKPIKQPSKSDGEIWLNEAAFDQLPPEFQGFIRKDNYKATKYGYHLRCNHRKEFDKWFKEVYFPTHARKDG
jgi:hypothetical protein